MSSSSGNAANKPNVGNVPGVSTPTPTPGPDVAVQHQINVAKAAFSNPKGEVEKDVNRLPPRSYAQTEPARKFTNASTLSSAGRVAGGEKPASLIELMDRIFISAPPSLATSQGSPKAAADTYEAVKSAAKPYLAALDKEMAELKSHAELKNAAGQRLALDIESAHAIVNNFRLLAQGKHPDVKKVTTGSEQTFLQNVIAKLAPQSSPVYKQLVSGFLQMRSDRPAAPVTPNKLFSDFKSDAKQHAYALLSYNPAEQHVAPKSDGLDKSQPNVKEELTRWYTSTQVYIASGLATGPQLKYLQDLRTALKERLDSIRSYGSISDARGSTFAKALGTGGAAASPSPLPTGTIPGEEPEGLQAGQADN